MAHTAVVDVIHRSRQGFYVTHLTIQQISVRQLLLLSVGDQAAASALLRDEGEENLGKRMRTHTAQIQSELQYREEQTARHGWQNATSTP